MSENIIHGFTMCTNPRIWVSACYRSRKAEAKKDFNDALSIIGDDMAQNHCHLPYWGNIKEVPGMKFKFANSTDISLLFVLLYLIMSFSTVITVLVILLYRLYFHLY